MNDAYVKYPVDWFPAGSWCKYCRRIHSEPLPVDNSRLFQDKPTPKEKAATMPGDRLQQNPYQGELQ